MNTKHRRAGGAERMDKPRVCDPGMCDYCIQIGSGDFDCVKDPRNHVPVVRNWVQLRKAGWCKRPGGPGRSRE